MLPPPPNAVLPLGEAGGNQVLGNQEAPQAFRKQVSPPGSRYQEWPTVSSTLSLATRSRQLLGLPSLASTLWLVAFGGHFRGQHGPPPRQPPPGDPRHRLQVGGHGTDASSCQARGSVRDAGSSWRFPVRPQSGYF